VQVISFNLSNLHFILFTPEECIRHSAGLAGRLEIALVGGFLLPLALTIADNMQ
jgi:hypothetical protein